VTSGERPPDGPNICHLVCSGEAAENKPRGRGELPRDPCPGRAGLCGPAERKYHAGPGGGIGRFTLPLPKFHDFSRHPSIFFDRLRAMVAPECFARVIPV
jgi:hypothetical protein